MKKIINGKKYDTGTATCVADWDNDKYSDDFYYVCESLYHKKTGEYFITSPRGMTEFLEVLVYDQVNYGGENAKIFPVSDEQAKEWTQRRCDGEVYEAIFGEVQE